MPASLILAMSVVFSSANASPPMRDLKLHYLAPPESTLYEKISSIALLPAGYALDNNCVPEKVNSRFDAPDLTADAHFSLKKLFDWTDDPPTWKLEKRSLFSKIYYATSLNWLAGPQPIPVLLPVQEGITNIYSLVDPHQLDVDLAKSGLSLDTIGRSGVVKIAASASVDAVMSLQISLRRGPEDHTVKVDLEGRLCNAKKVEVWEREVEAVYSPAAVVYDGNQPIESSVRSSLRKPISTFVLETFGDLQLHPSSTSIRAPSGACGRNTLKAMGDSLGAEIVEVTLQDAANGGACGEAQLALLEGVASLYTGQYETAVQQMDEAYDLSGGDALFNDARVVAASLLRAYTGVVRYVGYGQKVRTAPVKVSSASAPPSPPQDQTIPAQPPATQSSPAACPSILANTSTLIVVVGSSSKLNQCAEAVRSCTKALTDSARATAFEQFEVSAQDMLEPGMAQFVGEGVPVEQVVVVTGGESVPVVRSLSVKDGTQYSKDLTCP
jgi:hypothetical protein